MKLDKVKYIYHLADLHIRNLKRHKEYREVLTKFLSDVDSQNLEDSIIYLAGDIAHAKTEMSPELVREITWFFTECAKRRPTYVITGNHDCNLNNKDRLDVLTPICDNLSLPNLFYLRDTGVYQITDDITFTVYSILDKQENWPKGKDVDGKVKICFFHGPVDAARTDIGYVVSSNNFTPDIFDGFDMVLMGDIHKRQVVQQRDKANGKPIVVYAGSTVQQNHGEYLENHGYLLWDVEKETFEEYNIHNDYGYLTIDVVGGVIPQWVRDEIDTKLPKQPRLRVRFSDTEVSDIKIVAAELQQMFKVNEITITKQDTLNSLKSKNRNARNLAGNIKDVNVQNGLIKEYLERQFLLDDETLNKVIEINNAVNLRVTHEDTDNILWIPKKFEFSNMFSYGEGNKIEFDKAKGIIGLFAPNTQGKSSLFDALSFCIFDKCSRAFKATHIMNNQKDTFSCKFNFEIDGVDYFVEREAHTTKTGNVKVNVNFFRIVDGVEESLNGEERRDTNDIIRKYLGTYEDFVMTSLSLQGNNALFIDKSQSERKDILAQYMGVNVFDKLFDIVNEDNKEAAVLLKNFKKDDFSQKLGDLETTINTDTILFDNLVDKKDDLEHDKTGIERELSRLESQIIQTTITLDLDVETRSLNLLTSSLESHKGKLEKMEEQLGVSNGIISQLEEQKKSLSTFTINGTEIDIEYAHNDFKSKQKDLSEAEKEYQIAKQHLDAANQKIAHLDDHKYDPNCEFCCDNVFVKDAMKAKESLEELETAVDHRMDDVCGIQNTLDLLNGVEDAHKAYIDNEKEISNTKTLVSKIKEYIAKTQLDIKHCEDGIAKATSNIEEYHRNKEQIELNKQLRKNIADTKEIINGVKKEVKRLSDDILDLNTKISKAKQEKEGIEANIRKVKELEETNKLYDYYLDATKRDGISYELISKTLPTIEGEINNILGQIVEFSMNLQMDGKNVNAYINYGDSRKWPLEMCSGMEKFISGLAIRVALINICNLPRPNFLVIDEGFGTLDSENLQSLFMAFAYLKSQFEFVIVISHIDSMRDVVDTLLEIKKDNGFSSVRF
jgi:DNA repair exonuclease SbcCD ATPase subunit